MRSPKNSVAVQKWPSVIIPYFSLLFGLSSVWAVNMLASDTPMIV
jgi:hypothetical protein